MIQYQFDRLNPVVKDDLQFSPLNLLQKCTHAITKLLWPAETLSGQTGLQMTEEPRVRECESGLSHG
jgi:hypothetical protein